MGYYKKNLWILAIFNIVVVLSRCLGIMTEAISVKWETILLSEIPTFGMLVMSVLLILVARGKIQLNYALIGSYIVFSIYIWFAFKNLKLKYDTLVNIGIMIIAFSTITIHLYYHEENHWEVIKTRKAQALDLRISDPGQLFHPMVIGPHLEINSEIIDVVERFVIAQRELTPLELYIYCGTDISDHMQETAIEAFREHFKDEERRLNRILRKRTRRGLLLFCTSMSIIFVWSQYDAVAGTSILWTVLGNMGGFFLWEIGNTHFRHVDDYTELERALVCKDAEITFM